VGGHGGRLKKNSGFCFCRGAIFSGKKKNFGIFCVGNKNTGGPQPFHFRVGEWGGEPGGGGNKGGTEGGGGGGGGLKKGWLRFSMG